MKTKVGVTAIYCAAGLGKHETARILLDAGADVRHLANENVREKKRALSFYEKNI